MSDQDKTPTPPDDTEAHLRRPLADAESAEGNIDTEGHGFRRPLADAESGEGDDDTEGHRISSR